LNWSQPELAKHCGVHVQTISNFEIDKGSPTKKTLIIIKKALENAGIEFTEHNGVHERRGHIRSYEGKNIHRQLLDEIYYDLKDSGGEVLIRGLDESRWGSGDDEAFRG
jgi:transcriptional regulator with XRE-family HTH domain